MTQDLRKLQYELYEICHYDIETPNYLKYNQLLWDNIQGLDAEAMNEAIIQLRKANYENN